MIKVYKFGPAFGLPDASPFVMKVETYLRLSGQTYEVASGDVRKAPRSQLPFIEVDGKIIPDSTAIVDMLEAARGNKLDAHLGVKERTVALAFKSMLEEHLYFSVLYLRWVTDDGWAVFEPSLREMLGRFGVPGFMRGMVAKRARKQVTARVWSQGVGRQPRADIEATACKMVDAFAEQLGDKAYFCGDAPTTFDATTYAFGAGALCPAFDNAVRKHAATKANLVAYVGRLKAEYWKD